MDDVGDWIPGPWTATADDHRSPLSTARPARVASILAALTVAAGILSAALLAQPAPDDVPAAWPAAPTVAAPTPPLLRRDR